MLLILKGGMVLGRQTQEMFPAYLDFFFSFTASHPHFSCPNKPSKLYLLSKTLMNQSWLRVICLLHCIIG